MSIYLGDTLISGAEQFVGESRNIGQIIPSTIPLTDAGLHLLDGALIQGSGIYSAFVDYIADLYDSTQPSGYQYNINVIGNLTNNNGIISGFSTSNYATLPQNFNTSNSFECVVSFTTGASVSDEAVLGNYQTYTNGATNFYGVNMYIASGYLAVVVGSGTSVPIFHDVTQTVNVNTSYKVKLTFDGSDYKYYLAVGSGDYSLIKTTTSSATMVYNTSYPSYLGCWYVGHLSQLYAFFSGSIDLKESYININGSRWWTGAEVVKPIFCTEEQWQQSVTTYGVCGKFVYDSVANTVRLPKITGIVEGTTDLTALGDLVEAGLPNITGTLTSDQSPAAYYGGTGTGALNVLESRSAYVGTSNGATRACGINFDASSSNSIYGNSTTVQPQSIKVLYYIVVATSTKTEIEVDIDEIATDLNGKADVDLTNVSNAGTSLGAGWAMPSNTYKDLTLGASGTTYTALADGWVTLTKTSSGSNQFVQLHGETLGPLTSTSVGNGQYVSVYIPVYKGEAWSCSYTTGGNTIMYRFYYAIGSESEAS